MTQATQTIPVGYKQTEIGVIPEDWEVKKLGEVIHLQGGYAFKSDLFVDVGIPIIRISDVGNNTVDTSNSVYYKEFNIPKEFIANKGDALIAMSGATTGKIGVYDNENYAYINQRVGKFEIINKNKTSKEFISHIVRSEQFTEGLSRQIAQGAQPNISGKQIESIELPIPNDSKEQTAIATALSDTDALIEKLEKLIAKKKAIKQGAMQQLLTGKKRLPGFSGEWEVKTIKQMELIPVSDGPHLTPQFVGRGIPFLSVNNLVNNKISFVGMRYITKEDHAEFSKKCKPQDGDILLGKAASVGLVAVANLNCEFNIWSPIAVIRLKTEYNPKFFLYLFQTQDTTRSIKLLTNSSSQGNLGMGDIEKIEFKVPLFNEQTAIATVLSDMDAEIEKLENKLGKYRQIKTGMMQQLLTGKIRLLKN